MFEQARDLNAKMQHFEQLKKSGGAEPGGPRPSAGRIQIQTEPAEIEYRKLEL